jgi:hypothetical protein
VMSSMLPMGVPTMKSLPDMRQTFYHQGSKTPRGGKDRFHPWPIVAASPARGKTRAGGRENVSRLQLQLKACRARCLPCRSEKDSRLLVGVSRRVVRGTERNGAIPPKRHGASRPTNEKSPPQKRQEASLATGPL